MWSSVCEGHIEISFIAFGGFAEPANLDGIRWKSLMVEFSIEHGLWRFEFENYLRIPGLVHAVIPFKVECHFHSFPIAAKPHNVEEQFMNLGSKAKMVDQNLTASHNLCLHSLVNNKDQKAFKLSRNDQETVPPPRDWRFRILTPSLDNWLKDLDISLAKHCTVALTPLSVVQ